MNHGSDEAPQEVIDVFKAEQQKKYEQALRDRLFSLEQLGATGQFPNGKLTDHDEGEIKFGVSAYHGEVILNFGKPIQWIGMSPEQARNLALSLRQRANEIERNPNI